MAEPTLSSLAMLTEFFSSEHIEAAARQTGFVKRASVPPQVIVVIAPAPSLVVEPVWMDGPDAWVPPREAATRGSATVRAWSSGGSSAR